jgi:hypothetical protein
LEALADWSADGVLSAVTLEAVAFWSAAPVVVLAGGFCAVVLLVPAAVFWSVVLEVLGVVADGFTGALALSEEAAPGLLVVAVGAFALF